MGFIKQFYQHMAESDDPFTLLSSETTIDVLWPLWVSSVQECHRLIGESLIKSHKEDEGTGASNLWGKVEKVETIQPRKEKTEGGSYWCNLINEHKHLKRGWKEDEAKMFSVVSRDKRQSQLLCYSVRLWKLMSPVSFFDLVAHRCRNGCI